MVMLAGTTSRSDVCQPAWSTSSAQCLPGVTRAAILGHMKAHRLGVAPGQDKPGAGSRLGAYRTEDGGGRRALVLWRRGSGASFGPAPDDLVLLADPGLVGEPDLYALAADTLRAPDRVQARGETFLKASIAPCACAW